MHETPQTRILLVEDEESLILTLEDRLSAEGYGVVAVADGLEGFARAQDETFDLIVLDLSLPGKGGLDICRDLRAAGTETPILMLTAKAQVIDKVLGLKLGADDYLPKPFDMLELLARIESLLRRVRKSREPSPTTHFGDLRLDRRRSELSRGDETIDLSTLEYNLLCYLLDHAERILPRDELLDEVWGYDATPMTRTVDVHIASLRQKIEPRPKKPRHIVTVHGRGYKFLPCRPFASESSMVPDRLRSLRHQDLLDTFVARRSKP